MSHQYFTTSNSRKSMILIEFMKNTLAMGLPIPKTTTNCKKVILTFFQTFDYCAIGEWGGPHSGAK